ncbi:MAG: GAP1-N2 domain-containing protein, partial [Isosphaeraceae bacterium]
MSQELHYTSVPRGLRPGTRGFCTVAATPQMASPLAERLENLSGYQPVYPAHDPLASRNPINFAHTRFTLGGRPVSILSRVGPAGLDYTGRANKYAHHVVLDAAERPEGGPAWLLEQPGFIQKSWDGEPRMLPEGRSVPRGDRHAGVATAWAALAGDAGWAGALAESFLNDPKRPAFVVFRPGMNLLPLFVEAIALLPPPRRWDVEFSTYLTQPPRGITYAWRGVLEGSPEAANAHRLPGTLVIDLCAAPGRAQGGPLVHTARTGEYREWQATAASPPPPFTPFGHPSAPVVKPIPGHGAPIPEPAAGAAGNYELIPELASRFQPANLPGREANATHSRSKSKTRAMVVATLAACLLGMAGIGLVAYPAWRNAPRNILTVAQNDDGASKADSRPDGTAPQPVPPAKSEHSRAEPEGAPKTASHVTKASPAAQPAATDQSVAVKTAEIGKDTERSDNPKAPVKALPPPPEAQARKKVENKKEESPAPPKVAASATPAAPSTTADADSLPGVIRPLFVELPDGAGTDDSWKTLYLGPKIRAKKLTLLPDTESVLKTVPENDGFKVRIQGLEKPEDLAIFKIVGKSAVDVNKGAVYFGWNQRYGVKDHKKERDSLRAGCLQIETEEGRTRFALLTLEPKINADSIIPARLFTPKKSSHSGLNSRPKLTGSVNWTEDNFFRKSNGHQISIERCSVTNSNETTELASVKERVNASWEEPCWIYKESGKHILRVRFNNETRSIVFDIFDNPHFIRRQIKEKESKLEASKAPSGQPGMLPGDPNSPQRTDAEREIADLQ